MVAQLGHLEIAWLELWLACDEDVCFTEGTDTRKESSRIYEQLVFRQEKISIQPSEPYHHETDVDMPNDAMHSFVAAHNSITWKLIVKADSKKWNRIERVFPLIVHPAKVVAA